MCITEDQRKVLLAKAEELLQNQISIWNADPNVVLSREENPMMWFTAGSYSIEPKDGSLLRAEPVDGFMLYATNSDSTRGKVVEGIEVTTSTWGELCSYLKARGIALD